MEDKVTSQPQWFFHCQQAAQLCRHHRDTDTNKPFCVPDEAAGQIHTVKMFVVHNDDNAGLVQLISPVNF